MKFKTMQVRVFLLSLCIYLASGDDSNTTVVSSVTENNVTSSPATTVTPKRTTMRTTRTTAAQEEESNILNIGSDVIQGVLNTIDVTGIDPQKDVHDTWIQISKRLKDFISSVVRMLLPRVMEFAYEIDISPDCSGTALQLVLGLRQQKLWAFQLLDSSGLLPSGILEGRMTNLGNFDECMSIVAKDNDYDPDEDILFHGQYCLVSGDVILPPRPDRVTFRTRVLNFTSTELENTVFMEFSKFAHFYYGWKPKMGLCIPSTCTKDDLQSVFDLVTRNFGVAMNVTSCQKKEPVHLTKVQQAFLIILAVLLVLVVIGTTVEVIWILRKRSPSRSIVFQSLCCFSAYSNTIVLLTAPAVDKTLSCIHGVQALEILWLMISLCYLLYNKALMGGTRRYAMYVENFSTQSLMIGYQLIDRIIMIGAMAVAYFQFQFLRRSEGQINIFKQIIFKLFSVAPPLLFAIGFTFVWPLIGSGPLWEEEVVKYSDQCKHSWWKTALFFSNWLPADDICLPHTFYVSVTMQLFFLFLIVPRIIYRWPVIGLILNAVLGIVGMAISGYTSHLDKIPGIPLANTPIQEDYETASAQTHYRTYFHLGPYALGVFLGYLLNMEKKISIHPIIQTIFWLMVPIITLAVIYIPWGWHKGVEPIGSLPILYAALSRTVFCLPVMWILYSCGTGRGGPVNRFLSWSGFVPLGRMWYLIYLSHVMIIHTRNAMFRQTITLSHYDMACEWAAIIMISMVVSSVVHIFLEAPLCRLADVWLFWKSRYEDDDD